VNGRLELAGSFGNYLFFIDDYENKPNAEKENYQTKKNQKSLQPPHTIKDTA